MINNYDTFLGEEEKKQIIFDYTNNFLSIKEIEKKYNIKSYTYLKKLIGEQIRSRNEASKIAHKKYKEKYKHTEETKNILSLKQKEYIKNHTEEFSQRLKRKTSYPEQMFIKFLKENGYDKKFLIEQNYAVYPFFIDFAFVDIKLAIEIDGSQHLRIDRIESDKKKDKLLIDNGWKVLRFSENIVKTNWLLMNQKIQEIILDVDKVYEKVGILKYPKKKYEYVKKVNEYGLLGKTLFSEKEIEGYVKQYKVDRPSKETLEEEIKTTTFTELSKKYGVSATCISKWCKFYGLPSRKYQINGLDKRKSLPILICSFCGKEFKAHDSTQLNKKTFFCCEEHMHKYKKTLTKAKINGICYEITKDLIIEESKKYKSINEMARCLSISRFLLSRRIKEYGLNKDILFNK